MKKSFLFLTIMTLIAAAGFLYSLLPAGGNSQRVGFRILPKAGLDQIAADLEQSRLVRSRQVFKLYSFITGNAHRLKPGLYFFEPGFSLGQITTLLVSGPEDVVFTIKPGATLKEIDEALSALGVIQKGEITDFSPTLLEGEYPWVEGLPKGLTRDGGAANIGDKGGNSLEGFLLPDTYNFSLGSDPALVLRKILDNFKEKALPLFPRNSDLIRKLTLASLLEKEAPDEGDRRIIAGILEKRLNVVMPLQVDATVVYAVCGGKFAGCAPLKKSDYLADSPYNTYRVTGLPRGPIANPGPKAIEASLGAQPSAYWYYLSDPKTGKTIFSKTLDEHNQNRVKYLLNR